MYRVGTNPYFFVDGSMGEDLGDGISALCRGVNVLEKLGRVAEYVIQCSRSFHGIAQPSHCPGCTLSVELLW